MTCFVNQPRIHTSRVTGSKAGSGASRPISPAHSSVLKLSDRRWPPVARAASLISLLLTELWLRISRSTGGLTALNHSTSPRLTLHQRLACSLLLYIWQLIWVLREYESTSCHM